jgi:hypothetical protein
MPVANTALKLQGRLRDTAGLVPVRRCGCGAWDDPFLLCYTIKKLFSRADTGKQRVVYFKQSGTLDTKAASGEVSLLKPEIQGVVGTSDVGFWQVLQAKGYPWDVERGAYYRERSPLTYAAPLSNRNNSI